MAEMERKIDGTHGVSETDHGEASAADNRRDMGDAQGVSSAGISGNSVGDELHRETTWKCGTLGGVAVDL